MSSGKNAKYWDAEEEASVLLLAALHYRLDQRRGLNLWPEQDSYQLIPSNPTSLIYQHRASLPPTSLCPESSQNAFQVVQIILEHHCASSRRIYQKPSGGFTEHAQFSQIHWQNESLASTTCREARIILLLGEDSTWKSSRKDGAMPTVSCCQVSCWTIWKLGRADLREAKRPAVNYWNFYHSVIKSCSSTQDYKYLSWKNVPIHMINYMVFLIII